MTDKYRQMVSVYRPIIPRMLSLIEKYNKQLTSNDLRRMLDYPDEEGFVYALQYLNSRRKIKRIKSFQPYSLTIVWVYQVLK